VWRRIAFALALLIATAFVACTRAQDTAREHQLAAAQTGLRYFMEWYGQPSDGPPPPASASDRAIDDAVAQRFWSGSYAPSLGESMRRGLVVFSVDRLARELGAAEHSMEAAFLDGAIVWPVRNVRVGSPPPDSNREALALMTLERYLGWPVLQQALATLRARFAGQPAGASDLLRVAEEISGRHLASMQDLFDRARVFDYGIERVDVAPANPSQFRIEVVARRHGDGRFAGTTVAVTFADGQQIADDWDGREVERRFTYASTTVPVSAVIDPDVILVLDNRRANNVWKAADAANRAEARRTALAWSVRWAAWLQDRLLLWMILC
jgi:hypothetical protein